MDAGDDIDEPRAGARFARRALLVGGLGAGVGVAAAVGTAQPAAASTGTMDYGANNNAGTTQTVLTSSNNGSTIDIVNTGTGVAVHAYTNGSGGHALAGDTDSPGHYGVIGSDTTSSGSAGVYGTSLQGYGVQGVGNSEFSYGVFADGAANGAGGLYATSTSGDGAYVVGQGGVGLRATASAAPAIYAVSAADGNTVVEVNEASTGGGVALEVLSTAGTGLSVRSTTGTALTVTGQVAFSRSGVATVAKGAKSVAVSGTSVTATSSVFATIQGFQSGVAVAGVTVHGSSFTIQLTKAVKAALKVGWFVLDAPPAD